MCHLKLFLHGVIVRDVAFISALDFQVTRCPLCVEEMKFHLLYFHIYGSIFCYLSNTSYSEVHRSESLRLYLFFNDINVFSFRLLWIKSSGSDFQNFQVASSALGFGPQLTMQLAERLYTQGFIRFSSVLRL